MQLALDYELETPRLPWLPIALDTEHAVVPDPASGDRPARRL